MIVVCSPPTRRGISHCSRPTLHCVPVAIRELPARHGLLQSNARIVVGQNATERLPVRREEESILLPANPRLRCNDMGKPRYRNRDLLDFKCPARRPDRFEIEPAHHARQIHVGPHSVAGTCERASLDHRAGQRGISRFIKRFRPREQLESAAPAHTPRNEQVPGVRGQEEIAVRASSTSHCRKARSSSRPTRR